MMKLETLTLSYVCPKRGTHYGLGPLDFRVDYSHVLGVHSIEISCICGETHFFYPLAKEQHDDPVER